MTTTQMKKVAKLYSAFTALETSADLTRAGLTLSDYNELYRALQILCEVRTCSTVCKAVKEWIANLVEVRVLESYGYYIIELI